VKTLNGTPYIEHDVFKYVKPNYPLLLKICNKVDCLGSFLIVTQGKEGWFSILLSILLA